MKSLIGFNLIFGPVLFFFGGFVAYLINVSLGHIISVFLIAGSSYAARSYLFFHGRINKTAALVVNVIALLMAGAVLNANYNKVETFAEGNRAFVSFVGVWLAAIPVIIIFITLFYLIKTTIKEGGTL
jgi:hypothetical protein